MTVTEERSPLAASSRVLGRARARRQPKTPDAPPVRAVEALVRVRLAPGASVALFERRLREVPDVRSAMVLAGDHDFAVVLTCRHLADLRDTVDRLRVLGAEETSTQLILRTMRGPAGHRRSDAADPLP
jgi:DNA-binding Lrp family transcriptional regulator